MFTCASLLETRGRACYIIICCAALALANSFADTPLVALWNMLDDPRTAGGSLVNERGWV